MNINRPKIQDDLPITNFYDVFDVENPFISHVVISDCEINLEFNELIEFSNVKFVNVNFNGTRLDKVFFKNCLFNNCDLSDTHFYEASLRSEEHTSELQSRGHLVCRLLLEKKKL